MSIPVKLRNAARRALGANVRFIDDRKRRIFAVWIFGSRNHIEVDRLEVTPNTTNQLADLLRVRYRPDQRMICPDCRCGLDYSYKPSGEMWACGYCGLIKLKSPQQQRASVFRQ